MASQDVEDHMAMQNQVLEADALTSEIQFGVELEFLAPPDAAWQPPSKCKSSCIYAQTLLASDHAFHYLATGLQASGLQAAYLMEADEEDCEHNDLRQSSPRGSIIKTVCASDMRVMNPSSFRRRGKENPLFSYWLVKAENDFTGHGEHKSWHPTELNTPILRESEAANGFPALNTALHALRNAHPDGLHLSESCGMHVHMSPVSRLTTLHAKRVVTLVFLLEEHLLFHLCDPYRRRVHHKMSEASALRYPPIRPLPPCAAVNLPENLVIGMGATMNFLWGARQLGEICMLIYRDAKIRNARPTALNIKMQTHEDGEHTYTLEFRQAQASFNQSFIDNWVGLVLTICKVAFLPTDSYTAAVARIWHIVSQKPKPEETWMRLLRILNAHAPKDWRFRSTEQYWKGYLACQDRK